MLTTRILWLVVLALAPALAIQSYNEFALRAAREDVVRSDALRDAQGAAGDLADLGESLGQVLDIVAVEESVQHKDPGACTAYLKAVKTQLPDLNLLAVTEADGRVICNSLGSVPAAYSNAGRAYHQRALARGGIAVGDYVEGMATGKASVHVARPLRDGANAVVGVIVAAIDLERLSRRLTRAGLPPDAAFSVIDGNGRVLVRTPDSAAWVGRQIPPDRLATIERNVGEARDAIGWDGRRSIIAISRPNGFMSTLTVSIGRERASLFADIDAATVRGVVLILLGALVAFASALLAGRALIRRPARLLLAAAGAWRRGDLSARTGLTGASEFGRIGEACDAMAASLQTHETELRSEVANGRSLQAQQVTMLHELNHRVKNTLATVQSLARQARGGSGGAENLEQRILALSKTHDLLTRDAWTGASLREILENELGPYRNSVDHFVLQGPDVELPPRHVLALGMTFHELTTNAAKYGALSTPDGRIDVAWQIVPGNDDGERLQVRWTESGGPPVEPPTRRGFGTRLIAGGVQRELDGEVSLSYEVTGFRCSLEVPVERPGPGTPGPGTPGPMLQPMTPGLH